MAVRILLLGATGFVGGELWRVLARRHQVVATSTRRGVAGTVPLDLRDAATLATLAAGGFDLVVHAAGVVDLRAAERDPQAAWEVNVDPLAGLLRALPAATRLVFLSSDNVFDGTAGEYTEADRVAPVNTYGRTKAAAEAVVLAEPRHLVVRIPLVFGTSPRADRFLARFAGPVTPAAVDLICAPVYLPSFAVDLERLWSLAGVVHYGGSEVVNRLELMRRTRDALGLPTEVVPVRADQLADGVPRPARVVLRSTRHPLAGPDLDTALRHLVTAFRNPLRDPVSRPAERR